MSAMTTKEQSTTFPPALPVPKPMFAAGPPDDCMYKNRLQEYTQRTGIALPIYQILNEGSQHEPKFRSYVWVDGIQYTSPDSFSHKKSAEQDVARVALLNISEKIKNEGYHLIRGDTIFCKSILMEYAVKMHLEKPTYSTCQSKGLLPAFVSSLVFNGVSYTGDVGRTKKEAEQLAARAVILSILEFGTAAVISEIIKSKFKLYAALNKTKDLGSHGGIMPVGANAINDDGSPAVNIDSQPFHEFRKPGVELPANSTPLPILFVSQVLGQSSAVDSSYFNEGKALEAAANTNALLSAISGPSAGQSAGANTRHDDGSPLVNIDSQPFNELKNPRVKLPADSAPLPIVFVPQILGQSSAMDSSHFNEGKTLEVASNTNIPLSAISGPFVGHSVGVTVTDQHFHEVKKPRLDILFGTPPVSGPQLSSGSFTSSPMLVSQSLSGSITHLSISGPQLLSGSITPPLVSVPLPLSGSITPPLADVSQVLGQPSVIPSHASAPQPLSCTLPPTSVPQVLGQSPAMGSSSSNKNMKKKNKRKANQLPGMMSMGQFPAHPMSQ